MAVTGGEWMARWRSDEGDDELSETIAACGLFCRIFPDSFYVDRRGREYVDRKRKRDIIGWQVAETTGPR